MSARTIGAVARRAYGRVGSDFGFANVERVLLYGGILAVGYLIYKSWRVANTARKAAAWAAGAAGEGVANAFEWFSPLYDASAGDTYAVQFPDGSKHAVLKTAVSSGGAFTFGGVSYRMVVDKSITSGVNKFAVPV